MRQSPEKHSTSIIGSATPPRNAEDAASAPGKALPPILIEVWPGGMHAPLPHIRTDTAESSNRTLKESPLGTERAHQRPFLPDPISDIWGICSIRVFRIRDPCSGMRDLGSGTESQLGLRLDPAWVPWGTFLGAYVAALPDVLAAG